MKLNSASMKILLIFIFYLTSGSGTSITVSSYSGGSVLIISDVKVDSVNSNYICKVKETDCTYIIRSHPKSTDVQKGRFRLYNNIHDYLIMLIRKLKPQDGGKYRFGVENQNSTEVNLEVQNDACCGTKIMTAYLGTNFTFTCNYPEKFNTSYKYITKINYDSNINTIINTETQLQDGRFSMFDDKKNNIVSVSISDVSKDDEGFYLCRIKFKKVDSVQYCMSFRDIQLQVTDQPVSTMSPTTQQTVNTNSTAGAPAEIHSDKECFSSSAIIIVCVCAVLLLTGGFGLMYYISCQLKKSQGLSQSSDEFKSYKKNTHEDSDQFNLYENFCTNPE